MIRQLTCAQEKNTIAKSPSSTPFSVHKSAATKPWIWTSNTIDTGDYGSPTRHRRETEDMLSTADIAITKEASTSKPLSDSTTNKPVRIPITFRTTIKPEEIKIIASSIASMVARTTEKIQETTSGRSVTTTATTPADTATTTPKNTPTIIPTTITGKPKELITTQKQTTATASPADATHPVTNVDIEFSSINQGQLLSLTNGTIFDLIEVNDTVSDSTKGSRIIDETTTKVTLTSNTLLKKEVEKMEVKLSTEHPAFTTVSYYKEPPSKTSQAPITSEPKNDTKDLRHSEPENIDKEIEATGNSMVKLNRTSRKELPDFNSTTSDEVKTEPVEVRNLTLPDIDHRIVEITLFHEDRKKEGAKLYVTTKKHDKLKMWKNPEKVKAIELEKLKILDNEKAKMFDVDKVKIIDGNKGRYDTDRPDIKEAYLNAERLASKRLPLEIQEMLNLTSPTSALIDPKLGDLNSNRSKNAQAERIPIKYQAPTTTTTTTAAPEPSEEDEDEHDHDHDTEHEHDEATGMNKTMDDPVETPPEPGPRPNRSRKLTRPQRRSFYPYFFSRVLG